MSQLRGVKLRINYSIIGRLKFLSVLETTEVWERVMRQARTSGIDLVLTEGFNPRIKMSFSPPRSVGMESLCEHVDVRIDRGGATSIGNAITALEYFLNRHLPTGFKVTQVSTHSPKLLPTAAVYETTLFFPLNSDRASSGIGLKVATVHSSGIGHKATTDEKNRSRLDLSGADNKFSTVAMPIAAISSLFRSEDEFMITHKSASRGIRLKDDVVLDHIRDADINELAGEVSLRTTHSLTTEKQVTHNIFLNVLKTYLPFYFEIENIKRIEYLS